MLLARSRSGRTHMRRDTKDNLLLVVKSVLLVLGAVLTVAALVELFVGGPSVKAFQYLLVGLVLSVPPLAFAFRDALRSKREVEAQ